MKNELQAARDKDGVFLPKDTYEEQNKERERQQEEIKGLTKELKAKEQELEHFMVGLVVADVSFVSVWGPKSDDVVVYHRLFPSKG